MIRIGMILNEPPLPQLSAATRSSAAMVRAFQSLAVGGQESGVQLKRVVATSSNIAEEMPSVGRLFPEFTDKIQLLPPNSGNRLRSRLENLAWPMSSTAGPRLKEKIRQLFDKNEVEILHIEQLWPAYAVPASLPVGRVLVSPHFFLKTDMQSAEPPSGLTDAIFRKRLVRAELQLLRKFRHIRVLSAEMADTLMELHPAAIAHVVPLPIDPTGYAYCLRDQFSANLVVTCIGSMFWPPSRAAAARLITRLWPEIRKKVPQARLQIVGRDAFRYFREFNGLNQVSIHENVPDVTPYFLQSNALVYAPPQGSGMKVKVQEAMLHGLPVVTNHSGAEGLSLMNGRDALLAETDEELVEATVRLLIDRPLAARLSRHGRLCVLDQCGPGRVVQQLCSIYEMMMMAP